MDIAFPAILLFLIIAPGFIFRQFNQRQEVRAGEITPFSRSVLASILYACMINGVALWCAELFGYRLVLSDLLSWLIAPDDMVKNHAEALGFLDKYTLLVLMYFFATWLGAYVLARLLLGIVNYYQLDKIDSWFASWVRSHAPWHYLLAGQDHATPVDATAVAATVGIEGRAYLYRGVLVDYQLDEQGNMDRLVLANASRRLLEDDRDITPDDQVAQAAARYYPIDGDQFVLKYSQVSTLNLSYLVLSPAQS